MLSIETSLSVSPSHAPYTACSFTTLLSKYCTYCQLLPASAALVSGVSTNNMPIPLSNIAVRSLSIYLLPGMMERRHLRL